jgi:hypothetical protein
MRQPQPRARGALAVGMTNVMAEWDHGRVLVERGENRVVLERKMNEHDGRVNARFMSSCVSNAQRVL